MKVYIKDSLIVVNNKFENKIFIYDGSTRLEYQINEDTFSIIEDIKNNQYDEKQLLEIYPSDFINTLFAMGIITTEIQSNIHNVKRLTKYNNARIFIELTDKCNLKCKHCYGAFECKKNNTLDLELLKSVIDNASKAGVYQFDITGGEPFLYPKLKELLEYVYNAGMMVRIFSNLTLYNKNFKSLIVKYGVKEIVTSLDSCIKEDHDEFRGQIGSFEKTLKAIEDLKTTGVNISLNTMVGNHNKEHIEEMVTFISNLGVKSVLDVIVPEGRA